MSQPSSQHEQCVTPVLTETNEQGDVYQVRLEGFEGPLDLLLHLIRKNEINIYDIPIALIAQQYLDYVRLMKDLNLSFAGEFLVMAATLLHIKSRMLLPKDETAAEQEEEGEDPRSELVRRLVEYQQYKDAAGQLCDRERLWREIFRREPVVTDRREPREVLLDEVGLFDLLDALQDVLARTEARVVMDISPDTLTVQERINMILECLEKTPAITFTALFDDDETRLRVIVTFLALLELVRMRLVRIYQGDLFGPIRISRAFLSGSVESQVSEMTENESADGGRDAQES